jgi:FkbM family methyltransferase
MTEVTHKELIGALKRLGLKIVGDGEGSVLRPRQLIRQLSQQGIGLHTTKPTAATLQSYGFSPKTMIDVGVDRGTPMIYNAFPDAKFLLVDPLAESEGHVEKWKDKIDFDFVCCALGKKSGKVTMNIPSTAAKVRTSRASALDFDGANLDQFASFDKREVPMKKLDTLTKKLDGPFGLKIDTEGFEVEVLKGASRTLEKTEFVLAEGNVKRRYVDGYRFSDLVEIMAENGFEILDFLRPIRPKSADCDVLFARYDSDRFETQR